MASSEADEYEATPIRSDTHEIFSGELPLAQALQKLRARLLDLSTRNRLLSYRYPKGRSLQFVDVKNLDALYERLIDGKQARLLPVPELDLSEYQGKGSTPPKRPEAREQARLLEINVSYDLAEPVPDPHTGRLGTRIQTLFYPADLEKLAKKIAYEARTAIEETGTNMLYLVFGFLEFYDSDDSDKPLQAPLLSMPVSLVRGEVDSDTKVYRYHLTYNGEDVTENFTLREKLKQEFRLHLPEIGEDDGPETYFRAIQETVKTKHRWKVRRQLSLAMLSFGKLAIWADLDPARWPSLLTHELLRRLFEGGSFGDDEPLHGQDYSIDTHPQANLPLIYEADSSQHSALIDAISGKSMVINGPPGTGKSQTITNLIAASLATGKRVLFVSEKLAALEVVRHRLDMANLGHFCLELHSHKTQKKKLLEDLQARLGKQFEPHSQLDAKLAVLTERKRKLLRHAELMGLKVCNELGLTISDIFWAVERRRQELGDHDEALQRVKLPNASTLTHTDLEQRKAMLDGLSERYRAAGGAGAAHPWHGLLLGPLTPGDELDIREIVDQALVHAKHLENATARLDALGAEQADLDTLEGMASVLETLPTPPANLRPQLLAAMFPPTDAKGNDSRKVIDWMTELSPTADVSDAGLAQAHALVKTPFGEQPVQTLEQHRSKLQSQVEVMERSLNMIEHVATETGQPFDGSVDCITELLALASIVAAAPSHLMPYRRKTFESPHLMAVIRCAKTDHAKEMHGRTELGRDYYLDALPELDELKWAARVFRQGDSVFNIFKSDWRKAKKLMAAMSQNKTKRPADEWSRECMRVVEWVEHRNGFVNNAEYREWFGELFEGENTDFEKIEGLSSWYQASLTTLIAAGTLAERIDLTAIDLRKLGQLASRATVLNEAAKTIQESLDWAQSSLPITFPAPEQSGWRTTIGAMKACVQAMEQVIGFFKPMAQGRLAPNRVAELLQAKRDLANHPLAHLLHLQEVNGEITDIEAANATWRWGAAIAEVRLPAFVKAALLSNDAVHNDCLLREQSVTIVRALQAVTTEMHKLQSFGTFEWTDWMAQADARGATRPVDVVRRLQTVQNAADLILPWSKYLAARQDCAKFGFSDFVQLLEDRTLPPEYLSLAFERVFYGSLGREVFQRYLELADFSGESHDRIRAEYKALDKEVINLTGLKIAHTIDRNKVVPQGLTGIKRGDLTEMHLLRHELGKTRKHIPIRQLVKRAGRALQALKPCFMMGPLSVAQYLEPGAIDFDVIVMDEASQLRPEDALGAVARGKQLIVVGDPKQLPPTSFFDRMMDSADDDDEESPAIIEGSESILDICQQLFSPVRTLKWHYRSQHESLIAFSNFHFYKGDLIVFPSPYDRGQHWGVSSKFVRDGVYKDRRNVPEAARIVDVVLDHMLKHPDESLGVVSLNQTQRDLIQDLFDKKARAFDETQRYLEHWEQQGLPFFIKNLENVQGDERDVTFISTTFGKAPGTTKPRQNFGPISRPDGWRRLNVLFTRSRKRLVLFTSMQPEDIVVDEKSPAGTRALRDYLDFAKRGVLAETDHGDREPDSDFEVSVANVLRSSGYVVKPQLGVANFFIDLAVRNPERPGEFLVGIECDGATYHSSPSARDRDRIRQEILESIGWKGRIWHIWSADWFYNPRREIQKLLNFLDERRRLSALEPPIHVDDDGEEGYEVAEVELEPVKAVETGVEEAVGIEWQEATDAFVDIGDTITYCFLDAPQERHQVRIVEHAVNDGHGVINEEAPLATALLGLEVGEVGLLLVNGQPDRKVRVIKIEHVQSVEPS